MTMVEPSIVSTPRVAPTLWELEAIFKHSSEGHFGIIFGHWQSFPCQPPTLKVHTFYRQLLLSICHRYLKMLMCEIYLSHLGAWIHTD
jgi:hypothetical protein